MRLILGTGRDEEDDAPRPAAFSAASPAPALGSRDYLPGAAASRVSSSPLSPPPFRASALPQRHVLGPFGFSFWFRPGLLQLPLTGLLALTFTSLQSI